MLGLLVKILIIIGVIGGVVFASQSAYFRPAAQTVYSNGIKSENSYFAKSNNWLKDNIYPKLGGVSGEVAKTQDSVQQQIIDQKNNLEKSSTNAVKKYFAQKVLNVLGVTPEELGACPAN